MLLIAINFFDQKSIFMYPNAFDCNWFLCPEEYFVCIPMLLIAINFFAQKSIFMYPNAFDCN